MRAEPDRIYACLACASGFEEEKVCVIWNEAHLRAMLFASKFCLRQMHQDLVLSDGGDGIREQCPEDNHAVMRVLSRLIRELLKDHLSDPSYPWGFEASLG